MKRIGIVRTDRIGDMILTLPMLTALKELNSAFEVSFVARKYVKPILDCIEILDEAFYVDDYRGGIREIFKNVHFDCLFFPHPVFNEAYHSFLSAVPLRVGSGYRWYSFLYNYRIYEHRKKSTKHEAEHNVYMINSIANTHFGVKLPSFRLNEESLAFVNNLLHQLFGTAETNFFIIHPGSGGSAYEWQAENFGRLAFAIAKNTGLACVITGIENERIKCQTANNYFQEAKNLCGKLNLSQFIALISKSKLLVANSTGALHLAAALDVPVVGLYPNTLHISAKRWGPLTKKSVIISPPNIDKSLLDDMSLIKVEDVAEKAIALLNSLGLHKSFG